MSENSKARRWRAYLAASRSNTPPRPSSSMANKAAWHAAPRSGLAGSEPPPLRRG